MCSLVCSVLLDQLLSPATYTSLHNGEHHVLFLLLLGTKMPSPCDKPDCAICGSQMLVLCNAEKNCLATFFATQM